MVLRRLALSLLKFTMSLAKQTLLIVYSRITRNIAKLKKEHLCMKKNSVLFFIHVNYASNEELIRAFAFSSVRDSRW